MTTIVFPFDTREFFEKCVKTNNFPRNDFEKQAILISLLKEFEDNKKYSEEEINENIKKYFTEFTLIRRELINFGYMQRDPYKGIYWVVKRILKEEDIEKNTLLKRAYEEYLKREKK